jgi:hypothetical protein
MKVRSWKSTCVVALAVLCFCLPAFSQLNLGRMLGTVRDETGGAMANAKVTVTDQERGVSRVLTTDEAGAYAAPTLTPGLYTVRVEAMGFNTTERTGVLVQVGSDTRVDMVMKPGAQTQTVTVTEEIPLINTTSATLGGVIGGSEVSDLPVIAHNYQQLLQFQPGVTSKPGGGANGHSSNGARSDGNNWLFEGIFSGGIRTAGSIINTNSSTGDGASVVPPDAIQEMGVTFQNRAEYGWKPGVASNVGIKSGTNAIHGTAFAVGQTSKLNARNPFLGPNDEVPELAYEQYGATVGGPIKRDKLFFFAAFEGMNIVQGTPTTHTTPTTALIPGDATYSIPAAYLDMAAQGQIPAAAIDANGKVVNASLLTPQQQLSASLVDAGIFQTGISPTGNGSFSYGLTAKRDPSKNLLGKIDYHLSDKHQFSGEYFWARDTELGESQDLTQPYWMTDFYLTSNVGRINWTWLPNSSWVNEFHWGIDRKVENQWPAECVAGRGPAAPDYAWNSVDEPCVGATDPTKFSLPIITIGDFNTLGGGDGQLRVEGYVTFADNVSYTAGNHNMKFGFELKRTWLDNGSYGGKKGAVSFGTSPATVFSFAGATALQDFLMGIPSTGSFTFGNPVSLNRNWWYGAFVQDDWRITPRVTINLGLRWEYQTPLAEDDNELAQFDPLSPTGLTQLGTNGLDTPWKTRVFGSNIQPRFGVVWDVDGRGTTVVRAAYGIYSNWPIWSVFTNLGSNPTAALFYKADGTTIQGTGTIGNAGVSFPSASGAPGDQTVNWTAAGPLFQSQQIACGNNIKPNPGTCAISAFDQKWSLPFVQEWNVGIQRALGSAMSLDVAYVGSHGTDLIGVYDLNMPPVGDSKSANIQKRRPYYNQFPWMGKITLRTNKDFSNYNALQMTLNQRAWHGLTTTVGYTYSHTLDISGTDLDQNVYPDARCPLCNYGPTPFDIRHRVTIRATYLFPNKKSFGQILEGWQISNVVNLQGAIPWNTSDGSSNFSGTSEGKERWNLFGNASDFNSFGRFEHVPCFGVTGSKFDEATCTTVASVDLMPKACVDAANSLPTNPIIPSSDSKSTGLKSLAALGCYMSGNSVIVPPAQGTFGNMGKGIFRGVGARIWDISIRKNTRITERLAAQFQFDMYNVTNTPQFAIPGGNGNTSANSLTAPGDFGRSTATPNVEKGNVVGGSGDARRYQFGLKLTF